MISFNVDLKLVNNSLLTATITHETTEDTNLAYNFFLIKDGVVLRKDYSKNNAFSWILSSSGIYVAQGYVKANGVTSKLRRSFPIAYFEENFKNNYHRAISNQQNAFTKLDFIKSYASGDPRGLGLQFRGWDF
jgi:hypothetical protein